MKNLPLSAALLALVGCAPELEPTRNGHAPSGGQVSSSRSDTLLTFRPTVGGHLAIVNHGRTLALADAEHDRLRLFDINSLQPGANIDLGVNAWPTRVQDRNEGYDVLLRGRGQLARVVGSTVTWSVDVCAEPRGLAIDAQGNALVGCAGGELVTVTSAGAVSTRATDVEWRDVLVKGEQISGSSFRAAQLVQLGATSTVRTQPRNVPVSLGMLHTPQVAWKTMVTPAGVVMVHQLHAQQLDDGTTPTGTGGGSGGSGSVPPTSLYGNPVNFQSPPTAAVVTGVSVFDQTGHLLSTATASDVMPVDAALSPDGTMLAIAGAGGTGLSIYGMNSVNGGTAFPRVQLGGLSLSSVLWLDPSRLVVVEALRATPMQFDLKTGLMTTPMREPLSGSVAHALFHNAPANGAALACASCHPEGGEDGHVWLIDGQPRRTQSLTGDVMQRMPFHWKGDVKDLGAVMQNTFVTRMGGVPVDNTTTQMLGNWLSGLPAPRPSVVLDAAQRDAGTAAYAKAGCAGCHLADGSKGPAADIGTGLKVFTPSLIGVAARAPYLHDGRLASLEARVLDDTMPHGDLAKLSITERGALLKYLQSL